MQISINLPRVGFMSTLGFLAIMAIACASTGCVTVEAPDRGDCGDTTVIVVVVEPADPGQPDPDPQPVSARLNLLFGGPPSGSDLDVGRVHAEVLCFNASATDEMEIRKFRIRLHSLYGLVSQGTPRYADVMIFAGSTAVEGPKELSSGGSETDQDLVMTDVVTFAAGQTRQFCVHMDVKADAGLVDGADLSVMLLPFEPGDVILTSDASALPLRNIDPNTGLSTSLTIREITGPSVPMAAPTVSAAALPTTTLSNGTQVVARFTITANASADVMIKKLSFDISTTSLITTDDPQLRIVGQGSSLIGVSRMALAGSECGFTASPTLRCISVILASDVGIAAGTSVTFELRMTIGGTLSNGDTLTTSFLRDGVRHEGTLTGTGVDTVINGGSQDNMLWSNDGTWHYDGYDVTGGNFGQTLSR